MKTFWKIEETVGNGSYIVHDGIYETREACQTAINKLKSNSGCRPVLYKRGGWGTGPVRETLPAPLIEGG